VDIKAGMIVDVEASSVNKVAEVNATRTMIDRVKQEFKMKPAPLVGDTNYGIAAMLGWLVEEKAIAPHIPVWDKSEHHGGIFGRSSFTFDEENNRYVCPAGKYLRPAWRSKKRIHFAIAPAYTTVRSAHLSHNAVPIRTFAKSSVVHMIPRVMWHTLSRRRRSTGNHAKTERKWRCCLRTLSAY
jgi:hypothetical protein